MEAPPKQRQRAGIERVVRHATGISLIAVVTAAIVAFVAFNVHVGTQMTAGDFAVAVGTLLLASFTAWLGWSTRESTKAAARAATASERAVNAALANIEIDQQGVEAAKQNAEATRALLTATNTPYVVAVGLRDGTHRIHTLTLNGAKVLGFVLCNIGTGAAIVTAVELRTKDNTQILQPTDRYFAINLQGETILSLATRTWVTNPTTGMTFSFDYEAPDGRSYRTVCEAQVDGDGETLTPLKFRRETLRDVPVLR